MSEWQPWYSEEERRQRHYERYGTYNVPERQYRRRVGQAADGIRAEHMLVGVGVAVTVTGIIVWLMKK